MAAFTPCTAGRVLTALTTRESATCGLAGVIEQWSHLWVTERQWPETNKPRLLTAKMITRSVQLVSIHPVVVKRFLVRDLKVQFLNSFN